MFIPCWIRHGCDLYNKQERPLYLESPVPVHTASVVWCVSWCQLRSEAGDWETKVWPKQSDCNCVHWVKCGHHGSAETNKSVSTGNTESIVFTATRQEHDIYNNLCDILYRVTIKEWKKYVATVTSFWVLVVFWAHWCLTICGPFDKLCLFSYLVPLSRS